MSKVGKSIIEGMEQALAHARGEPVAVRVHHFHVPESVDVAGIRKRMKLTQREFSERFGFSLATVRDWEQKRRQPEGPARVLLTVIEKEPEAVRRALLSP